jgi:hypothetical protein
MALNSPRREASSMLVVLAPQGSRPLNRVAARAPRLTSGCRKDES